jgi:hypothetical protein
MKSLKKKNDGELLEVWTIFVLLLGVGIFLICIQPIDGGPNGGVRGIGGINALVTAIYAIASGFLLIRLSLRIDELRSDLKRQQNHEE